MIVAVCVALAAWIAIDELRPAPPATTPVLVAAHELDAGTALRAVDLRVVEMADPPSNLVTLDDAVGATLTIGAPAGLPVVDSMLLGPGLASAAPPGWVVVPATLADPVLAQLLRVGDRVDLYLAAADTGGRLSEAELVAAGALVLARPTATAADTSWIGSPSGQGSAVVVVAIPPDSAASVAGAAGFGPFRAVLSSAR